MVTRAEYLKEANDRKEEIARVIMEEVIHHSAPMLISLIIHKVEEKTSFHVTRSLVYSVIKKIPLHKIALKGAKGRPKVAYSKRAYPKLIKIKDAYCWVTEDAFKATDAMSFFKYVFMGPNNKYSVFVSPCSYNSCYRCGPRRNSCYGAQNCPHPVFVNYQHSLLDGTMVVVVYK
ncbi:MAG: hypothetical protein BV459_03925 [Thermoplasmata archaeon M11B2D]|nr:MAG: hypothetical protein BV459_03925 [Thermoplasmata archaeon M11B2D]